MASILEINNLSKKFNQNPIIQNLNLELKTGENICLFAPSGTGKTTLIKIINGSLTDFTGTVSLSTNNISTVFQSPNLFWYKTVRENILLPFQLKNIKYTKEIKKEYKHWLKITGLQNKDDLLPAELSGGMQQKVALIRGFLFDPDLILLDEPFKSIDIRSKNQIIDFILQNYSTTTILFVTHNIDEVPKLAQKVFFFSQDMTTEYTEINLNEFDKESEIIKTIFEMIY